MKRIRIVDILYFLSESSVEYSFEGNENEEIIGFSSLGNYKDGTITWIKKQENIPLEMETQKITLAITSPGIKGSFRNIIRTSESKHAFFSSIEHFFDKNEGKPPVGNFTYIGPNVKIGKNVKIGHNCSLDGDITIGDNTILWNNISIINRVTIGCNSEIQSGCVIGHDGFGYTENENNEKKMVKHYGGVLIGNQVHVSSNVCIERGTIDDTVIEDGTKIDSLSQISHNCYLGKNVALAFPCFLGGSSKVESNSYVAGGIIRNQCTVHENGFVGMGAVVINDVPPDTMVIGNPAKECKKLKS